MCSRLEVTDVVRHASCRPNSDGSTAWANVTLGSPTSGKVHSRSRHSDPLATGMKDVTDDGGSSGGSPPVFDSGVSKQQHLHGHTYVPRPSLVPTLRAAAWLALNGGLALACLALLRSVGKHEQVGAGFFSAGTVGAAAAQSMPWLVKCSDQLQTGRAEEPAIHDASKASGCWCARAPASQPLKLCF